MRAQCCKPERRDGYPGTPTPFLATAVLLAAGTLLAAAAVLPFQAARAQPSSQTPLPPKTGETGPTVPPPANQPDRTGVIRPPGTVDPQMPKVTPDPRRYTTPVIPPPGAPGGNPNVQPK